MSVFMLNYLTYSHERWYASLSDHKYLIYCLQSHSYQKYYRNY